MVHVFHLQKQGAPGNPPDLRGESIHPLFWGMPGWPEMAVRTPKKGAKKQTPIFHFAECGLVFALWPEIGPFWGPKKTPFWGPFCRPCALLRLRERGRFLGGDPFTPPQGGGGMAPLAPRPRKWPFLQTRTSPGRAQNPPKWGFSGGTPQKRGPPGSDPPKWGRPGSPGGRILGVLGERPQNGPSKRGNGTAGHSPPPATTLVCSPVVCNPAPCHPLPLALFVGAKVHLQWYHCSTSLRTCACTSPCGGHALCARAQRARWGGGLCGLLWGT